ncbi:Gfo/Idh/MocA family oxidoreductase [Niallia circulans]|uniref:Gfo/Idh/MocA family oxidoreductase n=1 Tax=Niallia circulans TaxID=1397 RepID=UPI002E2A703A|nr:Gfo/Idh/MocA family oxidoreductase [Niallia circulans]
MNKKTKCAVMGIGRLGYWHTVNASTRIQHVEVAAIFDIDIIRAEKVARELEIPKFTSNAEEIFQDETIEAVIIATPTSTHFEFLKQASFANKKIFVEKPLTIDIQEAKEITSLIDKNHTYCQLGFMRRYDPAYAEAKKRILAGDIGKPLYFKGISRDPDCPHESFIQNSGGIFVDVSIHDFDIARYLLTSEISKVSANGKVVKYPFVEKYNDIDQALSYIEFESGAAGDVEASRNAYYGYDIRAEIIGSEGTIVVGDNLQQHNLHIFTKTGKTHNILPHFPERFADAYYLELDDFFRGIRENKHASVTVYDGLKALEISYAARSSYLTQQPVSLAKEESAIANID